MPARVKVIHGDGIDTFLSSADAISCPLIDAFSYFLSVFLSILPHYMMVYFERRGHAPLLDDFWSRVSLLGRYLTIQKHA